MVGCMQYSKQQTYVCGPSNLANGNDIRSRNTEKKKTASSQTNILVLVFRSDFSLDDLEFTLAHVIWMDNGLIYTEYYPSYRPR